jgi:hypothetical protein
MILNLSYRKRVKFNPFKMDVKKYYYFYLFDLIVLSKKNRFLVLILFVFGNQIACVYANLIIFFICSPP